MPRFSLASASVLLVSLLFSSSLLAAPEAPLAACIAKRGLVAAADLALVRRGMLQVAPLWQKADGDLAAFCVAQLVTDAAGRARLLSRLERALMEIDGHMLEVSRALKHDVELDTGPLEPVDQLFAGMDVSAHVSEDLFVNKIAFVALLNFPLVSVSERLAQASQLSREDFAKARLTQRFYRRVPASLFAAQAEVGAQADLYIAEYNLWMHHMLSPTGERLFPSGKRLISHWNLRDELKAQYAQGAAGKARQDVIVALMNRIVTQTIPQAVINNPHVDYNPFTNVVVQAPEAVVERDAPKVALRLKNGREPDTRYVHWLAQFRAARALDRHSPTANTAIVRSFDIGREMPLSRVEAILTSVLTSPVTDDVARLMQRRLGRALLPQDLWYDGFTPRADVDESKLDAMTRARYPNAKAFHDDMPRMLRQLGFAAPVADMLQRHIVVDPARGAGHALEAKRISDFPHLRTRIERDGMDYKGYNIAVHEMGHNVEQVFSLYGVDHTLLQGVPNNAFTEAVAFVFQARDLELLGLAPKKDAEAEALRVLRDFWSTYEIAGVALVDVQVWQWLYAHPSATPAALREAVVGIAGAVWDRYYRRLLGPAADRAAEPFALLGIYSHMIAYPLYLSDYPLGHIIAFQIEAQLAHAQSAGHTLGSEIERMTKQGALPPDVWMQGACGQPVSSQPLLAAAAEAVTLLAKRAESRRE